MKRRLETVRKQDQLRWEREQAWDETHQQYDPQSAQAAAGVQSAAECPICASTVAPYPTNVPKMEVFKDVPWWERPGALAQEHILVPRAVPRMRRQPRPYAQGTKGSEALREIVGKLRVSMHAADAHRRMWEIQCKTESAVRRKHSLDESFQFQPDFWNSPISGLVSRRNFQQIQDNQRMAERRARGNTPRPKPPRSSLSHSELSEELQVDKDWTETTKKRNKQEELEKEARKVAQEIGYLYFVGAIDGMEEWKEDYLRSDRQLVIRKPVTISDSSESWDSDDDDVFDEMDLDE
ncbi:hypothetical protein N0V83_001492 [Neocucurbitaria cava]|uniref:Uncharacterized protein n=1 Tax=Neocucurbitaria cava TaxID=798079 RepID=A0A9W9CRE8_9PLEO|nr:hypothetical protein N0V83_001492 [Neocucurbitaria cava]